MTENGPVRIMIAGDLAFLRHAPTCIAAIRACTPGDIEIGVVTSGISDGVQALLRKSCPEVTLQFITINLDQLKDVFLRPHLSILTYARILMPEMTEWKRFIYLDLDIIVQRNLRELYEIDLQGHPLASVKDPSGGVSAGLLVVDAEAWRLEKAVDALIAFAVETKPWNADQDSIDAVFRDRVMFLDKNWNVFIKLLWDSPESYANDRLDEVHAIHYISAFKPWNIGRLFGNRLALDRWDKHYVKSGIGRQWAAEAKILGAQTPELVSWLKSRVYKFRQRLKRQAPKG